MPYNGEAISVPAGSDATEQQEEKQKPPLISIPPITVPRLQVPEPSPDPPEETPAISQPILDRPSATEATVVTIPGTDIQIPVPKSEIVAAAGVTSVISVGAALAATSIFKRLVSAFKPVLNAASKRIAALRKQPQLTFGRTRLLLRRHRRLHKVKMGG